MWIKLDKEAMKKFDLKQYDSVWSLAVDKSQIVYLRSDFSINKGKSGDCDAILRKKKCIRVYEWLRRVSLCVQRKNNFDLRLV